MPNYIIRVQLTHEHQPSYTHLRDGLLSLGFTKRVTDKNGIEWRLPNGNYRIDTPNSKDWVISAVQQVAFRIDPNPMIFVSEVAPKGMIWSGLQRC